MTISLTTNDSSCWKWEKKKKIAPSIAPLIAQKYIAKQAEIVTTTVKQTLIKAIKITAQELLTQIKYNINQHRKTQATKNRNKLTRNDYTTTQPHPTPPTHSPITLSWHQGAEKQERERQIMKMGAWK